ncbi:uncharacterized protein TNCV_1611451 [Trichonephila clavipes]|nr:uncharacterized protein TNCV_1611451 [Trichonephila clavipes]
MAYSGNYTGHVGPVLWPPRSPYLTLLDFFPTGKFLEIAVVVAGLKPVKIGLEKLCSQNATLLPVEGVFSFVIGELNELNSELAKNMECSLIQRSNERRNVNVIGLMQCLNFERKYEAAAVTVDTTQLPSKNCLVRQAQMREIGTGLFCEDEKSTLRTQKKRAWRF